MSPQIDHLVVVMMENRSFDHMLGFLKRLDPRIDGLSGQESNSTSAGQSIAVDDSAKPFGDLGGDPGHDFLDVNLQIFGTKTPAAGAPMTMDGFVRSYEEHAGTAKGPRVMRCFAPENLSVLATLALRFGVSDRWFSSVPGPTQPNRSFVHAATSGGSVEPKVVWGGLRTIFELLDKEHVSNRAYIHDGFSLLITVNYLIKHQDTFRDYVHFAADCKAGNLPQYTFIEPRYSRHGAFYPNDQHPDHDVQDGESMIRHVYEAIRANDALWERTLLVITYDEHGGLYDHVVPPAIARDPSATPPFFFDRLGVRVPAVFVSPWIEAGTLTGSNDGAWYEHSSIIAMARHLFAQSAAPLNARDAGAPTFEAVLNRATPRTDHVVFSASLLRAAPSPPPSELIRSMVEVVGQALAEHRQSPAGLAQTVARQMAVGPALSAAPHVITTEHQASTFMKNAAEELISGFTMRATAPSAAPVPPPSGEQPS
jgi:phospholipase C